MALVCQKREKNPMAEIEIEINGQHLKADSNQTVIQVADAAGIYIPRFCYHPHLSIPANCRMCLVEVEKSAKPLPACATPVTPGMKVFTKTSKTVNAQRSVMEFLLINHPLDCPVCDQGGECELQDLAFGYGSSHSQYRECKRSVADENLGPLIATEMTRCIQCTRCVRFGDEIAGLRELGILNRGESEEISTYVESAMKSELSGNIIDLCPVGALTSKPFRFTARAWELDQFPSVSPHDCLGSNISIHSRYGKVMRVVPRENTDINDIWISDRDRFSYTGLYHRDRLDKALAKINGEWRSVSWQEALDLTAQGIEKIIREHGADQLGALASANSTVEEYYLLQKIMRSLGSSHIDHRLREVDTQDQDHFHPYPGFKMPIGDLKHCDLILMVGCDVSREQPIAGMHIRKAFLRGAKIIAVNATDYTFNFALQTKKIIAPPYWVSILASIVSALDNHFLNQEIKPLIQSVSQWMKEKDFADIIHTLQNHGRDKKICVLLGAQALHHPQASLLRFFAQKIASLAGGTLNIFTDGANAAGAWLAGAIPHRQTFGQAQHHQGLSAYAMLQQPRQAYLLMNVEPEFDFAHTQLALAAFRQAQFIVGFSSYCHQSLLDCADVILPACTFTETSGTFINASGQWQSFQGAAKPYGESRPLWKILRVLGQFLHLEKFTYESSEEIKQEMISLLEQTKQKNQLPANDWQPDFSSLSHFSKRAHSTPEKLTRLGEIPLYALDSIVRRSDALQKTQAILLGELAVARIHPHTASALEIKEGSSIRVRQQSFEIQLPVIFDEHLAEETIAIAGGIEATKGLGDLLGDIEVVR